MTPFHNTVRFNSQRYLLSAALAFAAKGVPLFPCKWWDKSPYCRGGFRSATTDADQIREWWQTWPDAMIGVPTGAKSDLFVLDVDADKGGPEALAALEAEHGPLPETTRVRTGSGGLHYYLSHVDGFRCSAGILGAGLDVRTDGGYIIAPPSRSVAGPYVTEKRVENRPAPPSWLQAKLRDCRGRAAAKPAGGATGGETRGSAEAVSVELDGPPIAQGGRNHGLARVAGALKRRGVEGSALEAALLQINERRCSPALAVSEVRAVARSVDRYETGAPGPDARALAEIDRITRSKLDGMEWPGVGGKSERSILAALCKHAREWGRLIPGGVAVTISIRQLALLAATSKQGVINALKRLREKGHVRRDDTDRTGTRSGAIVLVSPGAPGEDGTRARLDHKPLDAFSGPSGQGLRGVPLSAPRMRWSAAGCLRVGKSGEAVIDALEDAGGSASLEELAAAVGTSRPRDLKRRIVSRLEERGIVVCLGGVVCLENEWLEAVEAERERAGEVDKARLDAERFERERIAWREKIRPDKHDGFGLGEDHSRLKRPEAARPVGTLAAAIRAYLDANPADAAHPAGWIGNTLWALDRVSGKPAIADVRAAIAELGGDGYLRGRLEAARGAA